MYDEIPTWLAVVALLIGTPFSVYKMWIEPAYLKDRSEHSEQNGAK